MIAAEEVGRKSLLMELHPPYVDVTLMRFEKRFGVEAILEATGQTFSEVKAERHASDPNPVQSR